MKKLFLFLIIAMVSFSSIGYSQGFKLNINGDTSMGKYPIKYDTVQAILLITECDTCNAKSSFGYIINKGEYGIVNNNDGTYTLSIAYGYTYRFFGFLNHHKKPFDNHVTVWHGKERLSK
jgi:hypothetical protein